GQTIKTRDVLELLRNEGDKYFSSIDYFDTNEFRRRRTSLFKSFLLLSRGDVLYYLPAHNNLIYIFPIVFIASRIFRFDIHYIVIGGWLVEYLKKMPLHRYFLKRIKSIYPENEVVKDSLARDYDFNNVHVLHNYRIHHHHTQIEPVGDQIEIVFMGRIDVMKGINSIFNLDREICQRGISNIKIDLYGPIFGAYKEEFFQRLDKSIHVRYKGVIQPNLVHSTLQQYDFMVLPTRYYTEGFPGSILDSYIAVVPLIVSDWKSSSEFVSQGITGLIYKFNDEFAFINTVIRLAQNPSKIEIMKHEALKRSLKYSSGAAW